MQYCNCIYSTIYTSTVGISHCVSSDGNFCARTIRDAIKNKVSVIDVDGSYLVRKHEQLHARQAAVNVPPLGPPPLPLSGWITINEANYKDESPKIPRVLPGMSTSISIYPYAPCNHVTSMLLCFSRGGLCILSGGSWTFKSS